jgi:hypothetical protein
LSKHYAVIRLAIEPKLIDGPHGNLQTGAFYGWMDNHGMALRALDHWRRHYPNQHVFLVKDQQIGEKIKWRRLRKERKAKHERSPQPQDAQRPHDQGA